MQIISGHVWQTSSQLPVLSHGEQENKSVIFFQTKPFRFNAHSFQGTVLSFALLHSTTNTHNRIHMYHLWCFWGYVVPCACYPSVHAVASYWIKCHLLLVPLSENNRPLPNFLHSYKTLRGITQRNSSASSAFLFIYLFILCMCVYVCVVIYVFLGWLFFPHLICLYLGTQVFS